MHAIGLILAEIGWAIAGLGVGGATAVAIGAAVVVGGSIAAAKAMGLFEIEMPQMDSDASRQTTVKSTVAPQKIIYGEALVSGPISYIALSGASNADLYQTIVLAGHEVNAITDIHFDDEVITNAQIAAGLNNGSNTAGNVTGGTFGPIDSNTICVINKHLGAASQASDPMLTNKFALYTSAHRGDGVAYLAMKWTLDEDSAEVWEKYSPGNVKCLIQGKKIYDPRLEVAAGGTAGASPTTAAYVTYSTNPALCVTDYLIDQTLGMGIAASKINWAAVITAANGCDVDVDVPNSATQKRFTANGVLFGTDSHQKNINKLLSAMNGRLIYSNGEYIVKAGIYEAPTEVLTEDDLIGAIQIKTSLERSDRFNTIRGIFVDAAANNKSTEFPKVQLADAVTRDNGEVLEKEIQLPMVSDSYQAQRIANKLIQLSDQQKIISFPANLSALRITAGDRVQVTVEELSWSQKVFECIGWTFSDEGGVNLTLREDSSLSYGDPLPAAYSQITASGTIVDAFRGVPSPSGLRAASGEKKVFLNWVNPGKPSDFGTIEIWASATNAVSSAVKIGETDGTQFVHDGNNAADQIAVGNTRVYWVRSKKNVGTVADDAVSYYEPNSTTGVGPITVLATLVDWDNVANPTIGIDINSDTISINTGSATTTTGQTVATSGLEAGTTVTQGGITMNQGGSIKGGQSAYNSGTGFFLGYDTNKYKFSIGNASNEALTFDGTNLAITGAITATSGTFTGTVNASAGAFTGDVSTDSKFIAGSGATSATMDGGDQNYRIYAGGTTPALSSFKVDSDGVVTATRLVVTRPDDLSAVIFDSARDGLVGIGLSSISQDTGIVVQAPAVELTSQTNTVSVVLTASQTLTLETILALPTAKKNAGNYTTTKYPASITATMEYSTNSGSTWSTFGTAVALTVTAATSPSDTSKFGVLTYAVDGTGRTGYRRDVHAIDSINNIHFIKAVAGFAAGSYLFRVQLSFVAGSSPDTDYEPNITGNRTLQFGTDGAGFTVDEFGVITDSPSGTATIGYVQANYVALNNGNTITVGSGETNTFEDESSNEILVVSDTEVVARNLFRATWNGAQPTSTKIIRVTNPTGTAERFSVTEAGNLTTSTLGVTGSAIITGNLTVSGTTTTVNVADLNVADKDITLNYSTGDSSSTANNAGIIIQDAVSSTTDASILWKTASDTFEFSHGANIPKTYFKATDQDAESGTWTSSTTGDAWGNIKFGAGYSYTYVAGAYKQYNIPAGADTCYMSLLKWSDGGYVDVHAVQADGDLVFLGRISTGQLVENNNHGNTAEHDGQAIVKIGTGLSNFSSIRITNKRDTFYFTGLAFSTQELDNFDSGMIAAETIHSGVLSNVTNTNWDAAYTYSQVGHLPLAGGTLTGAVSWPSGSSTNANTAYTYSQVGHLPLSGGTLSSSSTGFNGLTIGALAQTSFSNILLYAADGATATQSAQLFKASNTYTSWGGADSFNIYTSKGTINFHPAGSQDRFVVESARVYTENAYLLVGNNGTANSFDTVATGRIHFGALNSSTPENYSIGVNAKEDIGGDYTKLDIQWHTGVRIGANTTYGGTRFYNDAMSNSGVKIFSVGEGDDKVRVYNDLNVSNNLNLSGQLYLSKSGADSIVDIRGNGNHDPILNLRSDQGAITTEGFQIWYDNSVGDVHLNNTHPIEGASAIRFHTATGTDKATNNERFTINGNGLINIVSGNLAMGGSAVITNDRSLFPTSIEVIGSYSGGSGDKTNITNAQLKISSAGTADYWRIPHLSTSATVSGVYNYQTGKDVYWGEDTDTGTYYFRGRDLVIDDGVLKIGADTVIDASNNLTNIRNITAAGAGSQPFSLTGSSTVLYLKLGDATQTAYTGMQYITDDGNGQFWKAGSTYTDWGGADSFNIYNSNGNISFHPSATQNVLKLTSAEISAGRPIRVTGPGSVNTYEGVIKTLNSSTDQWSHIVLGGSATNTIVNNYYMIGRGNSIAAREMSFHIPKATNYGATETTQPKFRFVSSGDITLMSITADTGAVYVKGTLASGAITSTGQSFFGSTSGIKGTTSDATTNVAYFSFYESDGATRQGYIGYGSGGAQTLYINNDLDSNIILRVNGINNVTITDTSTNLAGTLSLSADTANVINFSASTTNAARGISFNNRNALSANSDGWLRLNQSSQFTNGVYTPLALRVDGTVDSYGGYKIIGTTIIDSSRNLTAVGGSFTNNVYIAGTAYSGLSIGETATNYASWNRQLTLNGTGNARMHVKTTAGIQMGMYAHDTWLNSGGGYLGTYNNYKVTFIINAASAGYIDTSKRFTWQHAMLIGGEWSNNSYNSVSATTLAFGGGNDLNNYSIGTSTENYNGDYTKLNLKWHTGIKFFTMSTYGGVRFFDDVAMTSEVMSIGKGDDHVRVANNLYVTGSLASTGANFTNTVNVTNTATSFVGLDIGSSTQTLYSLLRLNSNNGNFQAWKAGTNYSSWGGVNAMNIYTSVGDLCFHPAGTANVLRINAAGLRTTGNVTAYYSDMRLKTRTANIDNALQKVNSLSGFKYVENDLAKELGYSNDKQQVGLSAQQIQEVLPEAVSLAPIDYATDEHTGEVISKSGENYLTVDYSKLVPLLVEAIKELTQEVESLKTKLKEK